MANQPESNVYDAGVYQLEITDAVLGGAGAVANAPLLNLSNRTKYLKAHIDALEAGTYIPATVAPLNSPTLTGDPKAPTPAAGDSDTSIATTAFAQYLNSGVLTKSVAGGSNVTLSAVEAGAGIILLTGVLTAAIALILPVNGKWVIVNNTTGAFALTAKTAAGTGIVVPQTKALILAGDGTNIFDPTTGLVALYAALSGATFTGNIGLSGNQIQYAILSRTGETRATPAISGGVLTLDLSAANVFDVALNGAVTNFSFTNPFATGTAHGFTLVFTADGTARAVTWPASVKWPNGTAPTLTSTSTKRDFFTFMTMDGGTTWAGFVAGQNL